MQHSFLIARSISIITRYFLGRLSSLSQIHATFSRFTRFPLGLRHWGLIISTFCRRHFQMIFKNANEYPIIYQKLIPSGEMFCVYRGQKVNNSDDCYTILHQNPHNFHHKRFHLNFHHQRNYKPTICLELNTVPNSNVGWANVGPTSGRQYRRWANVSPTFIAVWGGYHTESD